MLVSWILICVCVWSLCTNLEYNLNFSLFNMLIFTVQKTWSKLISKSIKSYCTYALVKGNPHPMGPRTDRGIGEGLYEFWMIIYPQGVVHFTNIDSLSSHSPGGMGTSFFCREQDGKECEKVFISWYFQNQVYHFWLKKYY